MNTTLLLRGSNPAVSTGNKACDKFVVAFGAKVFAARFTVQKGSVSEDFSLLLRSKFCYKRTSRNLTLLRGVAKCKNRNCTS